MSEHERDGCKVRSGRRHPYECIDADLEEAWEAASRTTSSEIAAARPVVRTQLWMTNNPYATHYYSLDAEPMESAERPPNSEHSTTRPVTASPSIVEMSKLDWRRNSTTLLSRYMPAGERGRLRPHHRAFIGRVEARSSRARAATWNYLRKYDLTQPGLSPQFNRDEHSGFTEQKLEKIEALVKALFPDE